MNLNLCRLCYRPVLRGVNLSNGTMIHDQCLLAAQKKEADLVAEINERKNEIQALNDEISRCESFAGKIASLFIGSPLRVQEVRSRQEKLKVEMQVFSKEVQCATVGLSLIYDFFLTYPPDFEERKKRVAARDGECCSSCGQRGTLHLHHIQPLSKGGNNQLKNLTLLCERCHSKAHNNRPISGSFENAGTAYEKRVNDLRRAINIGRRVKSGYKKPQDKGYKPRIVTPKKLVAIDHERDSGSTLCIRGFCESRQENRTFSIKRMRGLIFL